MAIARLESPPPPSGGRDSGALGLTRNRPERELLALSRGGVLSPEQVRAVQYGFLLEAMTETAAELGYGHTSANEVIRRAKVSRRTFYELFPDLDQCFLAALHTAHDRVLEAVRVGYASAGDAPWETCVRASVVEVLSLFDDQPTLAELCAVQALAGPRSAMAAHQTLTADIAANLTRSAGQLGPRPAVPEGVVCTLLSGAWMRIHDRLVHAAHDRVPLVSLTGELMYAICSAFQGLTKATRQLNLPVSPPARDWTGPVVLPPEQARQRVEQQGGGSRKRVLRYLVGHAGASNLMVAEHVSATQSTTSRRLAGLARDGLIVSTKRAGRHAWHVTDRGLATLADETDLAARGR